MVSVPFLSGQARASTGCGPSAMESYRFSPLPVGAGARLESGLLSLELDCVVSVPFLSGQARASH